jgi:alpha-tubulin suppressor-like RCC1 family protein
LYGWGSNAAGQIGDNTTINKSSPVQVGSTSDNYYIAAVGSTGANTATHAIRNDNTLWAFGQNASGQLGLNNLTPTSSPTQVGALSNWSQIVAGYDHTVSVKTDGTLWSWGRNSIYGALGLGDLTHRSSPTQVGTASNWSQVAGIGQYKAALKTDGTLWSCGYNFYGQLGRPSSNVYSPILISLDTGWSKVVAGLTYGLFLKTNGTLWSIGNNSYGQLGLGDVTHRSSITQIGNLSNWSKIAASNYHSVAIKTDGTLWAWGLNSSGQLGQENYTNTSSPVQVGTLNTYVSVYAMDNTTLASLL